MVVVKTKVKGVSFSKNTLNTSFIL